MAGQRDLWKRLATRLTATEVARLVIEECWAVEHGREPLWTDTEILRLKQNVRTPQDVKDYTRLTEAYQRVSTLLHEAHVLALELQLSLAHSIGVLQRDQVDARAQLYALTTPAIVTPQQYEAIKVKQRAAKLTARHSLGEVLDRRAYALAPEEVRAQCFYDPALVAAEHPGLRTQAVTQITPLLQSGTLQLLGWEGTPERIEALLSRYVTGPVTEGESAELLERVSVSTEQLYTANLPEWTAHVDRVEAGYGEDEPAGYGYAILQEPAPELLDVHGHYKPSPWRLEDCSRVSVVEGSWGNQGMSLGEVLQHAHEAIRQRLQRFFAMQTVVEIVSESMGVRLTQDLEGWRHAVESSVVVYNAMIRAELPYAATLPPVPPLTLEALRPPTPVVTYLRGVLSRDLSESAWVAAFEALEEAASELPREVSDAGEDE